MDELKDKLKKLSLNPFKKTAKGFKGTGHVLGTKAGPAQSGTGASSSSSGSAHHMQQAQAATQRSNQQPQPQQRTPMGTAATPSLGGSSSAAAPSHPDQRSSGGGSFAGMPHYAAHSSYAPSSEPSEGASAAASPSPTAAPGTVGEAQEPASPEQLEAVDAAVAQLASDPLAGNAADVLHRLLRNVASNPVDPKYRRLRLSNPKIQEAVVQAGGGVELLLACGFQIEFEEPAGGTGQTEGFAVLDLDADLRPLHHAVSLLQQLAGPFATQSQQGQPSSNSSTPASAAMPPSSSGPTSTAQQSLATAAAAAPPPPPRQARQRVWDAPRPRATKVLLPQSPASDLPEWFFSRTGSEIKAAFLSAMRRKDQDQVLMTRATREKLRPSSGAQAATHALIRVRLPEGISLQGEFNPGEPVSEVFSWVSDCLRDPGCTYDLVLPSRKLLVVTGQAVREADLLPAVTLNFRWTGQSAAQMQTTPALRDDLLRAAQAAEPVQ